MIQSVLSNKDLGKHLHSVGIYYTWKKWTIWGFHLLGTEWLVVTEEYLFLSKKHQTFATWSTYLSL